MAVRSAEASGGVAGDRDAESAGGAVYRVSPDVLVPMRKLRAGLEAMRQRGQTQITFEGLRNSCLVVLKTGDGESASLPAAQCAWSESARAAAAVAAARIVYHYVKLNHMWSVSKDRRDRLYYLSSVLDTLDWMQGHVMLQDMADVVEAVCDGVTPRLRPVAPAIRIAAWQRGHRDF
jgi:hypothetical protein